MNELLDEDGLRAEFKKQNQEEYIKFEMIPEAELKHPRPDLCAFLFLHEKLGYKDKSRGRVAAMRDMIAGAEHDIIGLDYDIRDAVGKLTAADVIYLTRCGLLLGSDYDEDGFYMFA